MIRGRLADPSCHVSKLQKFRRNPGLFLDDSRSRWVRAVGRVAGPLLRRPITRELLLDPIDVLARSRIPVLGGVGRRRERTLAARRRAVIRDHDEPLVSVVMAAWNAENTLEGAVRSILDQTHRSLELLIVDDASSDSTLAVARALARGDDRVQVLSNPRQRGAAWTRNHGLSRVSGGFFTFQDADDVSHPERLERQLAALLERPEAMMCLCNYHREDPDGNRMVINGRHTSKAIIAMLVRAGPVLSTLGYLDGLHVGEDAEYYERIKLVFGDDAEILLFKTLYVARFVPSSLLFSDGVTTQAASRGAGGGPGKVYHVTHARSPEAEAALRRVAERHRAIRRGEAGPYVAFDPLVSHEGERMVDSEECPGGRT